MILAIFLEAFTASRKMDSERYVTSRFVPPVLRKTTFLKRVVLPATSSVASGRKKMGSDQLQIGGLSEASLMTTFRST
jgi:hypothetical protein